VGWKDYGNKRRKTVGGRNGGGGGKGEIEGQSRGKVTLATGSFDANVGIWEYSPSANTDDTLPDTLPDAEIEQDFTQDRDENEPWHFASLLTGPDSEIKSLAFSPPHYSANLLATSSRDKSVWIWEDVDVDEAEYETVAVGQEHTGDVKVVGWCEGAKLLRKKSVCDTGDGEGVANGSASDVEDEIVGSREVLASGSYDDTIRLWRDVEEEGDWVCVSVIEGHTGTVWDLSWEKHFNLSLPIYKNLDDEALRAEWEPRIISCSDDLSIRVWRREVSESEKEKKKGKLSNGVGAGVGGGGRLPSIIRTTGYFEKWNEEAVLPEVHVRSVYAVDWSRETGFVVSCGGDGTIAVYREVAGEGGGGDEQIAPAPTSSDQTGDDVVMNGTDEAHEQSKQEGAKPTSKWVVVAIMEAAHNEYEINHVCWAIRRDSGKRYENEEVIVSAGDDGEVKIWCLPDELLSALHSQSLT
jgi:cytosolic iron-sulfur protein assembly protein CIAO1